MSSPPNIETIYDKVLKDCGLTEETNVFSKIYHDESIDTAVNVVKVWDVKIIERAKDVVNGVEISTFKINYVTIDRCIIEAWDDSTSVPKLKYYAKKRRSPEWLKAQGSKDKYLPTIKGIGTYPFFPPNILDAYEQKTQIDRLFFVEGEKKALRMAAEGLFAVAVPGIQNWKSDGELYADVQKLMETCTPKQTIFLTDADTLFVEWDEFTDLSKRQYNFSNAAGKFTALIKQYKTAIYYGYMLVENIKNGYKGIDDILNSPLKPLVLKELNPEGKGRIASMIKDSPKYMQFWNVRDMSEYQINKKIFGLDNVKDFYDKHREKIGEREFIFNKRKWYWDSEREDIVMQLSHELKQFVGIGCKVYKKVQIPDMRGNLEQRLMPYEKADLAYFYGRDAYKRIPKYDFFVNVPSFTNYKEIVNGGYNKFMPFGFEPRAGNYEKIDGFLKHIFQDKYIFGVDWLTILMQEPVQMLPALVLVSKEFKTGKTTFLSFLEKMFTGNAATIGSEQLTGDFNSFFMNKLIIMVDETFIEGDKMQAKEKIKSLITAQRTTTIAKGKDAEFVDNYAKIVMTSNNETNFMSIDEGQDRFCVLKVPAISQENFNMNLLDEMVAEIPAFAYFLLKREIHHKKGSEHNPKGGRFYFEPSVYMTDALRAVMMRSKTGVQKAVEEMMQEMFVRTESQADRLKYTTKDLLDIIKQQGFNMRNITTNTLDSWLKEKKEMKKKSGTYPCHQPIENLADDNATATQTVKYSRSGSHYTFERSDWYTPQIDEDNPDIATNANIPEDSDLPF